MSLQVILGSLCVITTVKHSLSQSHEGQPCYLICLVIGSPFSSPSGYSRSVLSLTAKITYTRIAFGVPDTYHGDKTLGRNTGIDGHFLLREYAEDLSNY